MKSRKFLLIMAALLAVTMVRAQELLNYPLDTIDGEEVYRYEVERSIGLYRIGVNFGVSQGEIIRLNPQLRERGLHYGETLLIPTKRPVVKETQAQVVQTIITETRIEAVVDTVKTEIQDTVITGLRDTVITEEDSVLPNTQEGSGVGAALTIRKPADEAECECRPNDGVLPRSLDCLEREAERQHALSTARI